MPATLTTGSVNIASLDSKIVTDLCAGAFNIDLSPSNFIGSGALNMLGAKLRITNPYNVKIKDFPVIGYDMLPPFTDTLQVPVPTQAGNYQYGQYIIDVQITDANGMVHTVSKPQTICAPNPLDTTKKYGSLSALLNGICQNSKLYVQADGVPTYQGVISNAKESVFTLEYPGGYLPIYNTTSGSFSTTLFEGLYKFNGTICANYNMGDNISVKVPYIVKKEKNVRCQLDELCIAAKLSQLDAQVKSDCTDGEKLDTQHVIVETLRLSKTIEVLIRNGFDAGDYIDELEALLGCTCTCNCAAGTPIINQTPTGDFLIDGCNVVKSVNGNTTHYQIDNYAYIAEVVPNGGVLIVSLPVLGDCTQKQTFTFSIAALYAQVKNLASSGTEFNFWASILNKAWDSLDVTCLGEPAITLWPGLDYIQRSQLLFNGLCNANCSALISTPTTLNASADVRVNWINVSGVYEVAAYLDGILRGTVSSPGATYLYSGAADGLAHTWKLVAKCANGAVGMALTGSFTYYGCPAISLPVVSSANIVGATCPYDLTALVAALPAGITAEWHNLNNTSPSSLVPDPAHATTGTYFVFAKNSDGCYSLGVQVILTCTVLVACTAPQSLIVEAITGGYRVRFQSAATPPPLNSYSIKRRLTADPDVTGSYTAIGTPVWNAGVSRWEIMDATAVDNTLYTYRGISNCSGAPSTDYLFANIICPVLTLTPTDTTIGYSFPPIIGGTIDKYDVQLFDTGEILLHTDTILPAFSNPITGTFTGLTSGTYRVAVRVWSGAYYKDCPFVTVVVGVSANYQLSPSYGFAINSVSGTGVPSLPPTGTSGNVFGHHTAVSGSLNIVVSGTLSLPTKITVYVNNVLVYCVAVTASGSYGTPAIIAADTDTMLIAIASGTC